MASPLATSVYLALPTMILCVSLAAASVSPRRRTGGRNRPRAGRRCSPSSIYCRDRVFATSASSTLATCRKHLLRCIAHSEDVLFIAPCIHQLDVTPAVHRDAPYSPLSTGRVGPSPHATMSAAREFPFPAGLPGVTVTVTLWRFSFTPSARTPSCTSMLRLKPPSSPG